jgi:translation elongation factor EF-Tu-like GTPase
MGKLKEKLLNNLSNQEMDEHFELSAFEYVELLSKYKNQNEEEPLPTEEEIQAIERMVEDYYASKEFREYVENYQNEHINEYVDSLTDEQIDEALAEHNSDEDEIERINDSLKLKYTDDDVVSAIKALNNEKWLIDGVMVILNDTWNRKNGVI